jgi:hypothetical protein
MLCFQQMEYFFFSCSSCMSLVFIGEQRSTLTILAYDMASADIDAENVRESNENRTNEQHCSNGESKDPLQGNNDGKELGDTEG